MKRFFTAVVLLLSYNQIVAQEWYKAIEEKPTTIKQVEALYKDKKGGGDHEKNEQIEEGKQYQFGRWHWYWSRHTDENGYIVSPVKKLQEWQSWNIAKKANGVALKTTSNQSQWTFQGPDETPGGYNGIGRVNVIEFHPTDTNTFWVGSAGGGAWKTSDGGNTWAAVNDYFPVLGVSDIDFNPLNPSTVYLCTGDRDARDTYSIGILKSHDGGNTWSNTGFQLAITDFRLTNALLINPIDTNSLILATSAGLYTSSDAGSTWKLELAGEFQKLEYHPTDTSIIYATGLSTTASARQIYRSADGGDSWTRISNFPSNRRIEIAVTKADVSIVRAVVANNNSGLEGVYESTDTGKTFTQVYTATGTSCDGNILATTPRANRCGGQGWYDLTIAISPIDADETIIGGVNTWVSDDGGRSWDIANQWTGTLPGVNVVHADKHYHLYHPLRPTELYECNDGGVYKTTDPTNLWTDLSNGLGITQFYRNAVSNNTPNVIGGAQDNGSIHILNGGTYDNLTGGDGMDCQLDPTDNDVFYTSIQYGELRRTLNGGNSFTDIQRNIPGTPEGDWITPFVLHPFDSRTIIAGYNGVYHSSDRGNNWSLISPTYNSNIKRIALSARNQDYINILVSNRIYQTVNYGNSWMPLPLAPLGTMSDIHIDPKDQDHIWVTYSGYGSNKVAHYSLSTGWVTENDSLPNVPVNCIAIDSSDGTIYLGTDFGVFYRDNDMNYWAEFNNDLPNVEVIDLGINYTTNEIWAATYGRGMWKSPKHVYQTNSISHIPLSVDFITISPNPNNGSFVISTQNNSLNNKVTRTRIVSITGSVVWEQDVALNSSGDGTVDADIPNGSFIVELYYENVLVARNKMVKF